MTKANFGVVGMAVMGRNLALNIESRGTDHMRLSFCYPEPDRIREGVRRLAGVVNAEKQLVDMFGVAPEEDAEFLTNRHDGSVHTED